MKTKNVTLLATALAAGMVLGVSSASAANGTVTGAAGGAVTGAVVGGPVGAAVGGVAGAIVGTVASPPETVQTYVVQQPPPPPVTIQQPVVIGQPLPQQVVLYNVPENPNYAYAVVNQQRVIVDPNTRVVVQVVQ